MCVGFGVCLHCVPCAQGLVTGLDYAKGAAAVFNGFWRFLLLARDTLKCRLNCITVKMCNLTLSFLDCHNLLAVCPSRFAKTGDKNRLVYCIIYDRPMLFSHNNSLRTRGPSLTTMRTLVVPTLHNKKK